MDKGFPRTRITSLNEEKDEQRRKRWCERECVCVGGVGWRVVGCREEHRTPPMFPITMTKPYHAHTTSPLHLLLLLFLVSGPASGLGGWRGMSGETGGIESIAIFTSSKSVRLSTQARLFSSVSCTRVRFSINFPLIFQFLSSHLTLSPLTSLFIPPIHPALVKQRG